MKYGLLFGIGSGLVSGLILASGVGGGLVGVMFLLFLTPLPIAIAGLSWGWTSVLAASAAAAVVLSLMLSAEAALFHFIAIGLPLSVLTYLILLHRDISSAPSASNAPPSLSAVEWYPVGRVLAAAALVAGLLATTAILNISMTLDGLEAEMRQLVDRVTATGALNIPESANLTPDKKAALTKLLTQYTASMTAISWLVMAWFNLWIGGHVARISGQLSRPWPDLSTILAPRELSLAFIVAVLLSFLPGLPGLLASGFAGAIMMVYVIVGLAIVHNISRGSALRPLLLFVTYVALILLQPFSWFVLALMALAEPFLPFRRRGPFETNLSISNDDPD